MDGERLYRVVKNVTGHEIGDLVPLRQFAEPERLIRLGVLEDSGMISPFGEVYESQRKSDDRIKELSDEVATLRSELQAARVENSDLREEIEALKSPKKKAKGE